LSFCRSVSPLQKRTSYTYRYTDIDSVYFHADLDLDLSIYQYIEIQHPTRFPVVVLQVGFASVEEDELAVLYLAAVQALYSDLDLDLWFIDIYRDPAPTRFPVVLQVGFASAEEDELAVLYLAAVQSLAYQTRQICDAMAAAGHARISSVFVCGGLSKNPLYVSSHADAMG